jgi:hypothetical protein
MTNDGSLIQFCGLNNNNNNNNNNKWKTKRLRPIAVKYSAIFFQKFKPRLPEQDQFRMHELLSLLQQLLLLLHSATHHECLQFHLMLC